LATFDPGRPGGLIVTEHGEPIGLATLGLPESQRVALIDLLRRYGRQHPTPKITIPEDCIQAVMHYTSRTPTNGRLREAVAVAIEPAGSQSQAACDANAVGIDGQLVWSVRQ
jgi:hypothetical protein